MAINFKWLLGSGNWWRQRKARKLIAQRTDSNVIISAMNATSINYVRKMGDHKWNTHDSMLVDVNTRLNRRMYNTIPLIAGLQPLQANTGLVYAIRYKQLEGDSVTLEAKSQVVQCDEIPLNIMLSTTVLSALDVSSFTYLQMRETVTERALATICGTITNDIFGSVYPRIVPTDFSPTGIRRAIEQGSKTIEDAVRQPANTIIATSKTALDAVIAAAGESFQPCPLLMLPVRKVGTVFDKYALVFVDGCTDPAHKDNIVVTHRGDGDATAGYIYAPYVMTTLSDPGGDKQLYSIAGKVHRPEDKNYYQKIQVVLNA